jgi:hypothetical protein
VGFQERTKSDEPDGGGNASLRVLWPVYFSLDKPRGETGLVVGINTLAKMGLVALQNGLFIGYLPCFFHAFTPLQ